VSGEAVRLSEKAGDRRLLAEAENRRGVGLTYRSKPDEAVHAYDRAITLAQEVGDLETAVSALNNLGVTYRELGQFRDAKIWAERALLIERRMGDPVRISFMQTTLGYAHHRLGDWKQAKAAYEAAVQLVRAADRSWYKPYPLASLGTLLLNEGDRDHGVALMEEALELAEQGGDRQAFEFYLYDLAEQDLLDNEPAKALERLEPLHVPTSRKEDLRESPIRVWAFFELGQRDEAEAMLALARKQAAAARNKDRLQQCAWAEGMITARWRRWDEAEHAYEEAIKLAREMETPLSEAKALYRLGLMYAAKGEHERAREWLGEALRICRELGAGQYTGLIERALIAIVGSQA
jgi:tetratricopeptide (TPR) repeat protein